MTHRPLEDKWSDDTIKGNVAVPGGSLGVKPTWKKTFGVFFHVGFLHLGRVSLSINALFPTRSRMSRQSRTWYPASGNVSFIAAWSIRNQTMPYTNSIVVILETHERAHGTPDMVECARMFLDQSYAQPTSFHAESATVGVCDSCVQHLRFMQRKYILEERV